MEDGRYQDGRTAGGKWGCAVSAIIGLPLMTAGSPIAAFGGNQPLEWLAWVGGAAIIAALIGLGLRAAINASIRFFGTTR